MSARVLIVDDDADTRRMIRALVEGEGFDPLEAADGEAALETLDQTLPDIILLDAVMPRLDGFETCRRIKARPDGAHIPIIFMTGLADSGHVVEGLQAGGVDYVTKPIELGELAARLHVHLGNARRAQGTLAALASGSRRLFFADDAGAVTWSNAAARKLLTESGAQRSPDFAAQMRALVEANADGETLVDIQGRGLKIAYLGGGSAGEHLFTLIEVVDGKEEAYLQRELPLTMREAEVLLWVSRGKANRDISDILNISPRTVNKHLEQIFSKLGVENRAAATAIALETLHAV